MEEVELEDLRNIGTTVAQRLREVGIDSLDSLASVGSAGAYRRMQTKYLGSRLPVCYYLYSLEGAIKNKDWRAFSDAEKRKMRQAAGVK